MKKYLFFILFTGFIFASEIKSTSENFIKDFYGVNVEMEFQKLSLDIAETAAVEIKSHQNFFGDFLYTWKIIQGDTLAGIAVLDNVYGKSMPITFLVIFDPAGSIETAHIIKYREQIGGEIGSKGWLKQFEDKNALNSFTVGQEIDGISGATISVHSVTKGIKKLTLFFPFMYKKINELH